VPGFVRFGRGPAKRAVKGLAQALQARRRAAVGGRGFTLANRAAFLGQLLEQAAAFGLGACQRTDAGQPDLLRRVAQLAGKASGLALHLGGTGGLAVTMFNGYGRILAWWVPGQYPQRSANAA